MLQHGQPQGLSPRMRRRRNPPQETAHSHSSHSSTRSPSSSSPSCAPALIPRPQVSPHPTLLLPLALLLLSLTPSPSDASGLRVSLPSHLIHHTNTLLMANNYLRGPTPRLQSAGRRFPQSTVQYNDAGVLNYYWGSLTWCTRPRCTWCTMGTGPDGDQEQGATAHSEVHRVFQRLHCEW